MDEVFRQHSYVTLPPFIGPETKEGEERYGETIEGIACLVVDVNMRTNGERLSGS